MPLKENIKFRQTNQTIVEARAHLCRQFQVFDKQGKSASLTAGEFRLLECLVLAHNRALTRDYLYEVTRDAEFSTDDRAVDLQIGRIRKKINDDSKLIRTVRGVGYMFCNEEK